MMHNRPDSSPPDRLVSANDLVGATEIADLLERSHTHVYLWFDQPDFPRPVAIIGKKTRIYLMSEVRAWFDARPVPPEHGTTGGYQRGCRCDLCTVAHREYHREWKRRRKALATGGA